MQLFSNPELTDQITGLEVDLGIVPAGDTKTYTFYLHNDQDCQLTNIQVKVRHPEVTIIRAPQALEAKGSGAIEVQWAPSVTVKQGLNTPIEIFADELWR